MKTKHKIKLKDQNKIMNQSNKSEHDDQNKTEIKKLKISSEGSKTDKNSLILIFFRLNRRHQK